MTLSLIRFRIARLGRRHTSFRYVLAKADIQPGPTSANPPIAAVGVISAFRSACDPKPTFAEWQEWGVTCRIAGQKTSEKNDHLGMELATCRMLSRQFNAGVM